MSEGDEGKSVGGDSQGSSAQNAANQTFHLRFGGGRLRANIEQLRNEVSNDPELLKQAVSDFFEFDRQGVRNHFEGRLEYLRQINEHREATVRSLVEYGLQTLKWSFFLNAGAIAIVMAFVSGGVGKTGMGSIGAHTPVIKAIWPFVAGCVSVTFAGAAGFLNFSHYENGLPSFEMLHNFLAPTSISWPIAKAQKPDESPADFAKRFIWKVNAYRRAAIGFGLLSALLFIYGAVGVLYAALN